MKGVFCFQKSYPVPDDKQLGRARHSVTTDASGSDLLFIAGFKRTYRDVGEGASQPPHN